MLKWFAFSYFIALTPLFAMDPNLIGLAGGTAMVRYRVGPPREKSSDEIIAGARAKGQIEFLSCEEWLQKVHPHFNETRFAAHPLFSTLRSAMALADFEVDTLTGFIHRVMKPDMANIETATIATLRKNAGSMKMFVLNIIDCLEGNLPFETFIEWYLKSRFEDIVAYQAETMGRTELYFGQYQVKARRITEADVTYTDARAGFLRAYNTKNAIIRDILYFLRDKHGKALVQCLPRKVIHLLTLSSTLHPFLNGENEEWLDYDIALERSEGRNFLGNAAQLEVDLQKFFNAEKIRGVKKPKVFTELSKIPIPTFLKAKKKKPKVIPLEPTEEERLMCHIAKIMDIVRTLAQDDSPLPQAPTPQPNTSLILVSEEPAAIGAVAATDHPLPHPSEGAAAPAAGAAAGKVVSAPPLMKPLPAGAGVQHQASNKDEKKGPKTVQAVNLLATDAAGEERRDDAHASTIYDIFRPHGYKSLDDSRIITAWKHILRERGFHKEDTGSSHQPLYADLQDGSRVVMRFFRSSGYGPHYIKYVREAFEAIGYGKAWLIGKGYKI